MAANNLVGLFIFSFLNTEVLGSGVINISILLACFSGNSVGLLVLASMSTPVMGLSCIKGLMLDFKTNMSWFGFNLRASIPIRPLTVASWLCTTSSVSKTSAMTSWSSFESVSISLTACSTSVADGISFSGNSSSNRASVSSVHGSSTVNSLSLIASMIILMSAVFSDGKVATSLVLIFSNVSFRRFLISPDSIFPFMFAINASRSEMWSFASSGLVTGENPSSSGSLDDFLVALGIVVQQLLLTQM